MLSPLVLFIVLGILYLTPMAIAYNAGLLPRVRLFIIVCLFVSAVLMFAPVLVLLSTPATVFSLSAAGASIILPGLLWFAAFAAACLSPSRGPLRLSPTEALAAIDPARMQS